ncbi:MAG: anhydro-N-acetylmuramic acid kinase [Pseudomonadota bacterium]
MPVWHAIGIMSGTSADGVDCALLRLEEQGIVLLHHHATPYPHDLRQAVLALNQPATDEINAMGRCARRLGHVYAAAARELIERSGMAAAEIDLIGCHGQTIRHQPDGPAGFTLQIGWADVLAEETGITTVADFRPRDVVAGGQGAPLVPPFHQALFQGAQPRIILNLGGMANLTWLPGHGDGRPPVAFDTGPGNVLMDALARRLSQGQLQYDKDGAIARQGQVHAPALREWLEMPYFQAPPPKSTGRELFDEAFLERPWANRPGSGPDLMATLMALTAESVALAVRRWTLGAEDMLVFGGGAENPALMAALQKAMPEVKIQKGDTVSGIPSQALEAMAFAWLGLHTLQGLPGNLPSATGARHAVPLGVIHPGANWREVIRRVLSTEIGAAGRSR